MIANYDPDKSETEYENDEFEYEKSDSSSGSNQFDEEGHAKTVKQEKLQKAVDEFFKNKIPVSSRRSMTQMKIRHMKTRQETMLFEEDMKTKLLE